MMLVLWGCMKLPLSVNFTALVGATTEVAAERHDDADDDGVSAKLVS